MAIISKWKYGYHLLITIFAFLLYGNTFNHLYNLDDELVTRNHKLTSQGIKAIPEILSSPYYQDNMGYFYEYRPLVLISFAIEHEFFGEIPAISHFVNVLLYSITGIIMLMLLINLFPRLNIILPLTTVLFFIAHPLHTEVVANIKNRDEILSLLFGLLAFLLTVKASSKNSYIFLAFSISMLFFSLLSKNSTLAFIFILPLILYMSGAKAKLFFSSGFLSVLMLIWLLRLKDYDDANKIILLCAVVVAYVTGLIFGYYSKEIIDYLKSICLLIKRFFLNVDWPAFTFSQGNTSVKNIFLIYGIYLLTLCLSVFLGWKFVAFTLYIGSLFCFYWYKNYREGIFFLIIISTFLLQFIFPKLPQEIYLLLGVYILMLYQKMNVKFTKPLIIIGIFLLVVMVAHDFILHKKSIWMSLSIVSSLIIIGIIKYLSIIVKKRFIITLLSGVLILIHLFFVVTDFSFESIFFSIFLFFSFIYINNFFENNWKKVLLLIKIVISVLVILSATSMLSNLHDYIFPEYKFVEEKLYFPNDSNRVINEIKVIDQESRPLDFVEFPLGLDASINKKLGTAFIILGEYLNKLVLPIPQNMAFYYGYDTVKIIDITKSPSAILLFLLHMLVVIVSLIFYKKHKIFSFSMIIYLSSIMLVCNLFAPIAGMIADRLTYVASFGFCIFLAYVICVSFKIELSSKLESIKVSSFYYVTVLLILSLYSYSSIARSLMWKDHLALMRNDIKHLNNSAQAHNLLAVNLMKYSFKQEYVNEATFMHKEAAFHFRRAIEIYPDFFNAWYDLGRTYMVLNNLDSAFVCFVKVHEMDSTLNDATLNIAMIAEEKQDYNTAIKYYERSIRFNPYVLDAYNNLSYLYFRLQQPKKSIEVNQRALAYNPNWREPRENIQKVEQFLKQNNLPLE